MTTKRVSRHTETNPREAADKPGSYLLSQVFGASRGLPSYYHERKDVDSQFLFDLANGKHLIIYGSSGQGKSSLVKHQLDSDHHILIQCSERLLRYDVYRLLLSEAGVYVSLGRKKKKVRGVEANITLYNEKTGTESETSEQSVQIDLSNINDVLRVLCDNAFDKTIVFEDFHRLRGKVQRQIAADLKVVYEKSPLQVVIVGVWRESDKLSVLSGDLAGRADTICVDGWTRAAIEAVIAGGAQALNVVFAPPLVHRLIELSMNNIGVLQNLCYRACQLSGVNETQGRPVNLTDPALADQALAAAVEAAAGRYRVFVERYPRRGYDGGWHIRKWIMHAIVSSHIEDLDGGLSAKAIHEYINRVHSGTITDEPNSYDPNMEEHLNESGSPISVVRVKVRPLRGTLDFERVEKKLARLERYQRRKQIVPMILSYDVRRQTLHVVDVGFLVFLKATDRQALLDRLPRYDDEKGEDDLVAASRGELDRFLIKKDGQLFQATPQDLHAIGVGRSPAHARDGAIDRENA